MLAVNIFANDIMLINYYITIIIIFAHDSEKIMESIQYWKI